MCAPAALTGGGVPEIETAHIRIVNDSYVCPIEWLSTDASGMDRRVGNGAHRSLHAGGCTAKHNKATLHLAVLPLYVSGPATEPYARLPRSNSRIPDMLPTRQGLIAVDMRHTARATGGAAARTAERDAEYRLAVFVRRREHAPLRCALPATQHVPVPLAAV